MKADSREKVLKNFPSPALLDKNGSGIIKFASSMACLLTILFLSGGDISFSWYWDLVFHSLGHADVWSKQDSSTSGNSSLIASALWSEACDDCLSKWVYLCLSSPIPLDDVGTSLFSCFLHFNYILPSWGGCKSTEKTLITTPLSFFPCDLV